MSILYEWLLLTMGLVGSLSMNMDLHRRQTFHDPQTCQPIRTGFCKGMYYQQTRMPNLFNHQSQEEALDHASKFQPWIQINCSKDLQIFICTTFFPMCVPDLEQILPPCRSLCERVKSECYESMLHLNFHWPANLSCERFPRYSENPMCITNNHTSELTTSSISSSTSQVMRERPIVNPTDRHDSQTEIIIDNSQDVNKMAESVLMATVLEQTSQHPKELKCECSCRTPLVNLVNDGKPHIYKDSFASLNGCSQQCKSPLLRTNEDSKHVEFIQGIFSSITFICSTINLVTFIFNRKNFPYPERSIIFISMSFLPISIGYLIKITFGHEKTSCEEIFGINQAVEILLPKKSLSGKGYCASVFLLTYFFSISGSLWWVVSSITWFLSSTQRWSYESILKYSQCYHFITWSISGILTALVLMTSGVEGDPITGLCTINTNPSKYYVLIFEIIPHTIFLIIGIVFCVASFLSLLSIRKKIKFEKGSRNFEFLIMKMGIFGLLYVITRITQISLVMLRYREEKIMQYQVACDCTVINLSDSTLVPYERKKFNLSIVNFQIISYFMIGIISSLWMISRRGFNTWLNLLNCHLRNVSKREDSMKHASGKLPLNHQTMAWSKQPQFENQNSTTSSKTAAATPLPAVPLYNQTKQLSTYANSSSPLLYHQQFQQQSDTQQTLVSPLSTSLASSNGSQNQYYQLMTSNTLCSSNAGQSISKYSKISNYN